MIKNKIIVGLFAGACLGCVYCVIHIYRFKNPANIKTLIDGMAGGILLSFAMIFLFKLQFPPKSPGTKNPMI